MNELLHFAARHWWSLALIAGALVSLYIVYRNRSKLMMREDD